MRPPSRVRAVLDGVGYELRAPAPADAGAVVEAVEASLLELRAFMPWAHAPVTVDAQYERLVTTQADYWSGRDLVFHLWGPLHGREALLGCQGLHRRTLNPLGRELGYWTRTEVAGRGLATFAARCLVVLAFSWLGCERVQCAHNASNGASRRVNEKVGFRVEGELRWFEGRPTAEMVAAGAVLDPILVMRGLVRDDLGALDWYAPLAARLEVDDWEGKPLPRVDAP